MSSPNQSLPNWGVPLIDVASGVTTQPWFSFFAGLAGQAGPITAVKPRGSPFSYTASVKGFLAVSGGTVSAITLARARVSGVPLGMTNGVVPLSQGDTVTITYSVAPTLNFIPL
jgi:hypothetical protein